MWVQSPYSVTRYRQIIIMMIQIVYTDDWRTLSNNVTDYYLLRLVSFKVTVNYMQTQIEDYKLILNTHWRCKVLTDSIIIIQEREKGRCGNIYNNILITLTCTMLVHTTALMPMTALPLSVEEQLPGAVLFSFRISQMSGNMYNPPANHISVPPRSCANNLQNIVTCD